MVWIRFLGIVTLNLHFQYMNWQPTARGADFMRRHKWGPNNNKAAPIEKWKLRTINTLCMEKSYCIKFQSWADTNVFAHPNTNTFYRRDRSKMQQMKKTQTLKTGWVTEEQFCLFLEYCTDGISNKQKTPTHSIFITHLFYFKHLSQYSLPLPDCWGSSAPPPHLTSLFNTWS